MSTTQMPNVLGQWVSKDWAIYHGDNIELIDGLPDNSIGLTVSSPPFPLMYVFSNSPRDVGNVKSISGLIEHFRHLVTKDKLYRVMKPGRHVLWHVTQAVATMTNDQYIGMKDFRGKVIDMMEEEGWIHYGEVVIDKNPQIKAMRTHDRGLLFKTLAQHSEHMHMAFADYLLDFRKPGDCEEPIRAGISERYNNPDGWITADEFIEWAAPVWYRHLGQDEETAMAQPDYPSLSAKALQYAEGWQRYINGILETDTLNVAEAREAKDERHVCPLQLGVCERAIKLWSNPGDSVLDVFGGIGSVSYKALQLERKTIMFELKESYARTAVKNMQRALDSRKQQSLF